MTRRVLAVAALVMTVMVPAFLVWQLLAASLGGLPGMVKAVGDASFYGSGVLAGLMAARLWP